jgi:hypothetical protein
MYLSTSILLICNWKPIKSVFIIYRFYTDFSLLIYRFYTDLSLLFHYSDFMQIFLYYFARLNVKILCFNTSFYRKRQDTVVEVTSASASIYSIGSHLLHGKVKCRFHLVGLHLDTDNRFVEVIRPCVTYKRHIFWSASEYSPQFPGSD